MLISVVSFRHRSLYQSHESDALSNSKYKIAKIIRGFTPEPVWGKYTAPSPIPAFTASLVSCTSAFSPCCISQKTGTLKKLPDRALTKSYDFSLYTFLHAGQYPHLFMEKLTAMSFSLC